MTTPSVTAYPPAPIGRTCTVRPSTTDNDLTYVQRARSGDSMAFAWLWDKYWRDLNAFFKRQVNSREEAEDLASETLLAAFDQLQAFRGLSDLESASTPGSLPPSENTALAQHCTFQTYLYAIARNKVARWIRRKTCRPCCGFTDMEPSAEEKEDGHSLEERLGADAESDPLQALLRQEHLDEVDYALADVGLRSCEQFTALVYHYFCEQPHKEVASLFALRNETVNTRLQEGRRTLLRHYRRASQSAAATVSC